MADPAVENQMEEQTEFLWLGQEEIFLSLKSDAQTNLPQITNYNSGGVFRTFLEIVTRAVYAFYTLLANVLRQAFVQSAEGAWLDLKVGEIGIVRKPATQATGTLVFQRSNPDPVNVVIPAGTIVKTPTDTRGRSYRFLTTEEVVLPSGLTEVDAAIVAEFAGAEYNVGTGTISVLVSVVDGVEAIENREGWLTREGTDVETDGDLRERHRLKWEELARGSTKMAYVGYAKEVNGVVDVSVDDHWPRGMGTVDIFITGTGGMPTQSLIDAVQANIDDKKPICSDAQVFAPQEVTVNAAIQVKVLPGTPELAAMQSEAAQIVNSLFIRDNTYNLEDLRFKLGEDVTQDRIILALSRYLTGIKRVDCGFSYISVDVGELAAPGAITVTVSEEAV